jgi:hypothetical protein
MALAMGGVPPHNPMAPQGGLVTYNVRDYGAKGDGRADDAAALRAALSACAQAGGGTVLLPTGIYLLGSDPLPRSMYGVLITGEGMAASILKRGFSGPWFTLRVNGGNFLEWRDLTFDGQYGRFAGAGFVYEGHQGGAGQAWHRFCRCRFLGMDGTHIEIGIDAAEGLVLTDCEAYPGPGQGEYRWLHTVGGDTGARFRRVDNCCANLGFLTLSGAIDSFICNSAFKRIETDAACQELFVANCLWGNLDGAMTISGPGHSITGCRFSGGVRLDASFTGQFSGNFQTSGDFVDQTVTGNAIVLHHQLSAGYNLLGKLRWSGTAHSEEVASFRVGPDIGDSDFTLVLDQGPRILRFNTRLTANRAVFLPPGRDGLMVRVIRQAGCTGPYRIDVGPGPMKSLADAGEWCDLVWNGPGGDWMLAASGRL